MEYVEIGRKIEGEGSYLKRRELKKTKARESRGIRDPSSPGRK